MTFDTGFWLALPAALIWGGLLLLPWRPWSTREHLAASPEPLDLGDITALIPARNEAEVIERTLSGLRSQGEGLRAIVVDDQSEDDTAALASRHDFVRVIAGAPLPPGWAGKLWALEQGRGAVTTPMTLLVDADIELRPGMLAALLQHKRAQGLHYVSIMADLRRTSFWDRLLLPAFVYFFKLLYPFALSNSRNGLVAAGAGGCVLVDTAALEKAGAFASLRGALIDDCALARRIKSSGHRSWIGLSRDVISLRPYGTLDSIWQMVARSAYTQLYYSTALLLVLTAIFAAAYWLPIAALALGSPLALVALLAMMAAYVPTLRYYELPIAWALLLPLTGTLYLAMTWGSALRYWRGERSRWKNRQYASER